MTWLNLDDAHNQLRAGGLLLATARNGRGGVPAGQIYIDSKRPVRCQVEEGGREARGWYWLSTFEIRGGLYVTGSFGIYHGNNANKQNIEIRLDGKVVQQSAEEKAAIRKRNAERQRQAVAVAAAEAARAARLAARVWAAYLPTGESAYLKSKAVDAHGLRFDPAGAGTVVVPMVRGQQIVGLQLIRGPNRGKKLQKEYFPAGMNKIGAYHLLGRLRPGGACFVAEGYATAASIFEALGQSIPVAVAFDAGSLLPVAESIAKAARNVQIIIAADDDRVQRCRAPLADTGEICGKLTYTDVDRCQHCGQPHQQHNPGRRAAELAAHAVGGTWVAPVWPAGTDWPEGGANFLDVWINVQKDTAGNPTGEVKPRTAPTSKARLTDFNDLQLAEGQHVVRQQLEAHLLAAGIVELDPRGLATPSGGGHDHEGGGNSLARQIGIDDCFERYSLIYAGKGTLFDHREHCLVPKSDVLDIAPDHAWRELKRLGGLPLVRLSEVGFDPAGVDPAIRCNLWGGWPTTPKAGTCTALLSLLEHLCAHENNVRDVYQWVLHWLAYPIQHPGAKMRTALVFHGPQGVGKNLFFESVMAIYGEYGRIIDQSSLEDKFNDWASRKLFLIGDEVVSRQELYHVKNKLKSFVTGEWLRINPKNVSAHDERNHVNIVFLSNEQKPMDLEKDDRRYAVVWTPDKLASYHYQAVRDEIRAGGIAALHQYLLDLDLGTFDEYAEAPMTKAKRDLIEVGLESPDRFLRDWRSGDIASGKVEAGQPVVLPFCACGTNDLYGQYKRWCAGEGIVRPRDQASFLGYIGKQNGWTRGHKDIYPHETATGTTKRQRMVVPSAADLTEGARRPGSRDWRQPEGKLQAEWLTECFFAFRDALPSHL